MVTARKTAWPDDACINIHDESDIVFWTERFRVSPAILRQAVRIVGSKLRDVSCFLHSRGLPDQIRFR
jgi:hypothetical protein